MKNHKQMTEIERKIHKQFTEYGRNAREWLRKCALLLPKIERNEIWQKKGFSSIYEYAAKIAGMNRNSVNEALRILEKISDKPELKRVVEERGINAVKPVVTIATKETSAFWAAKAKEMSKNTLETYVRDVRDGRLNSEDSMPVLSKNKRDEQITSLLPRKATITMELDCELAEKLHKLKGQGSWDDLMQDFVKLREEKLALEKPEPMKTTSRYIPKKIKNYSLKKTNGTCVFPGCTKPYAILHHTQRFGLEKIHDPDRLAALCKEHERIAHLGLIENEEKQPDKWRLRQTHDPAHYKRQVDELVWLYR